MALRFISPDAPVDVDAIVMLVYGIPSTGKTSLALGASNPVLVNFEGTKGYARAVGSAPRIDVSTWAEVAAMRPEDFADYDTIIVDTIGQALEALGTHLIHTSRKNGTPEGGLSLKGYGALKSAFVGWTKRLVGMGKDVVLLAHAVESKMTDDTVVMRPDVTGKSADQIYKFTDVMGYLSIGDDDTYRVLTCAPTRSSYGKNPAGWGSLRVNGPPGNFIARQIAAAKVAMSRNGTPTQINVAPTQENEAAPVEDTLPDVVGPERAEEAAPVPEPPPEEPAVTPEAPEPTPEPPPEPTATPTPAGNPFDDPPEIDEAGVFNRELQLLLAADHSTEDKNKLWARAKAAGLRWNPSRRAFVN